jgi:thiamine transport system ATP-binding protein
MHRGRVEQIGPPADVWRRPESELVARFLGWNVTYALGSTPSAVRPDAVTLTAGGSLRGTVVSRAFRRDHFRVLIELDGSRDALDVSIRGAEPPAVGTKVGLVIDPDGVVELDR